MCLSLDPVFEKLLLAAKVYLTLPLSSVRMVCPVLPAVLATDAGVDVTADEIHLARVEHGICINFGLTMA